VNIHILLGDAAARVLILGKEGADHEKMELGIGPITKGVTKKGAQNVTGDRFSTMFIKETVRAHQSYDLGEGLGS